MANYSSGGIIQLESEILQSHHHSEMQDVNGPVTSLFSLTTLRTPGTFHIPIHYLEVFTPALEISSLVITLDAKC